MQRFPNEASCIDYLNEQREQSGIVFNQCGRKEGAYLRTLPN